VHDSLNLELDYVDDIEISSDENTSEAPIPDQQKLSQQILQPTEPASNQPPRERAEDRLANNPDYFFLGAPSCYEPGPIPELLHKAKERARSAGVKDRKVSFIPRNIICIEKKEEVTLPTGEKYSLSSFWLEKPVCSKE